MTPQIVSFATSEPRYTKAADHLRRDCEEHRMPHWIEVLGSWGQDKNERTIYKPTFIRRMLEKWDRPILWVDADSRLLGHIKLEKGDFDIGLCPNPFGSRNNLIFSSGMIWVQPSQQAFDFLRIWESSCQDYYRSGYGDHYYLIKTVGMHLHLHNAKFKMMLEEMRQLVLNGGDGMVAKRLVCEIRS